MYLYTFFRLHDSPCTRHMFPYAASVRPLLKKQYHNRLERVRGYLETLTDFDELISP